MYKHATILLIELSCLLSVVSDCHAALVVIRNDHDYYGADTPLRDFYNALPGVTASLVDAVSSTDLASADLFIAPTPNPDFTADELTAMSTFLASGGRLFFLGDGAGIAAVANARINTALAALGSSMRLDPSASSPAGQYQAKRAYGQVYDHWLTAGVDSFHYGYVGRVNGIPAGEQLFKDIHYHYVFGGVEQVGNGTIIVLADITAGIYYNAQDNEVFFANVLFAAPPGSTVIPEPSSVTVWWLLGTLCMAARFGARRTKRRSFFRMRSRKS